MITNESIAEVLKKIEKVTEREVRSDDPKFNPMDWSGGNFDDAYAMGVADGKVMLARELKVLIGL